MHACMQQVYDVTPFMEDHPGGSEVLLASTGKDATDDFEDIGHSDDAKAMMDKYYIGDLEKSYKIERTYYAPPAAPTASADDKTSESIVKILQFLAPLFIFALAFAYAKN
ncbi:putative cytochrome b5-like heme/steroid binding domain, cytochrome b5, heme-binding protein [Helianthus debilis subsp. tardiflorus]